MGRPYGFRFIVIKEDPAGEGATRPHIDRPWTWALVSEHEVIHHEAWEFAEKAEAREDARRYRDALARATVEQGHYSSSEFEDEFLG